MFDSAERVDWTDLGVHPVAVLAALAEANQVELKQRENRVLLIAAAWADAHPGDPGATSPLVERGVRYGGEGTPLVGEFAVTELAPLLGKSHGGARALVADVLDIRHRLPRLWQLVEAGLVHGWQARRIAQATRPLPVEAAAEVDRALSGYVGQLGWTRFERLLEAAVTAADPVLADRRTEQARRDRGVWSTGAQDGQKTIVARTDSSTATWFMAVVNRIADTLAADGDTDSADLRRSKALGWLAQPERARNLLSRHIDDPTDDIEPQDLEPSPSQPRASAGEEVPPDPHPDPDPGADPHHGLDLTPTPAGSDPTASRPRVVLHFHLSDTTLRGPGDSTCPGMVRPEHGSPITVDQLREFLTGTGCIIKVQPVLDPADTAPIDAYEISHRMRRAVRYRDLGEIFPYGTNTRMSMDLDHTVPYRTGGPPGQTRYDNLGPLSRPPHRARTFQRWFVRQPDPGTYLWRSRHGRVYLVTNHGSLPLGDTAFSHALWDLAAPTAS